MLSTVWSPVLVRVPDAARLQSLQRSVGMRALTAACICVPPVFRRGWPRSLRRALTRWRSKCRWVRCAGQLHGVFRFVCVALGEGRAQCADSGACWSTTLLGVASMLLFVLLWGSSF